MFFITQYHIESFVRRIVFELSTKKKINKISQYSGALKNKQK